MILCIPVSQLFRGDGGFAAAFPHHLVRDGEHIAIAHGFRRVGQRHDAPITFIEFFLRRLVSQIHQRRAQCIAPGMLSKGLEGRPGTPTDFGGGK